MLDVSAEINKSAVGFADAAAGCEFPGLCCWINMNNNPRDPRSKSGSIYTVGPSVVLSSFSQARCCNGR